MGPKVDCLIVDTTAFIKNAPLHEISSEITTVQEVVNEITSKRQIRRLVVLPYDLVLKEVFPENVQFITDFSKKTGDYPSLSSTDIKVMALTYQLEKEKVGTSHLNTTPTVKKEITFNHHLSKDMKETAGFFFPSAKDNEDEEKDDEEEEEEEEEDDINESEVKEITEKLSTVDCAENGENKFNVDEVLVPVTDETKENENKSGSDGGDDEDDDDDDADYSSDDENDSDSGWITPQNLAHKRQEVILEEENTEPVKVACITSDFAMQNVLKQIGLNVLSTEGRVIQQLRSFILRCYACFKTTSVMTKIFCPNCGNKTLKKVAVSLKEDGTQLIHLSSRKRLTARGKRYSLPTPQGGKHAKNPILCEDQRLPDQRPTRLAKTKTNPLDPDYIAGYSPFVMRDINSRSAMLGIRGNMDMKSLMRKEPNNAKRKGKKKK